MIPFFPFLASLKLGLTIKMYRQVTQHFCRYGRTYISNFDNTCHSVARNAYQVRGTFQRKVLGQSTVETPEITPEVAERVGGGILAWGSLSAVIFGGYYLFFRGRSEKERPHPLRHP